MRELLEAARPYVAADSGNGDRLNLLIAIDAALVQPPAAWMNSYGYVISNQSHEKWGAQDYLSEGERYTIPLYR
jgi:hypothetical protein